MSLLHPKRTLVFPLVLVLNAGLLMVAGCDQPGSGPRPRSRAGDMAGLDVPAAEPAPPPAPAPAAPDPAKPREILGKRTQDIRDVEKEKQAGGVVTPPRIVSKDPIRITGNAYVSIIGQASIGLIDQAVRFYQAETGEYPKTTEEFMEKIIKANNIALPKLPFYQEYAYDPAAHSLVIMEYPDRKEKANYPQ